MASQRTQLQLCLVAGTLWSVARRINVDQLTQIYEESSLPTNPVVNSTAFIVLAVEVHLRAFASALSRLRMFRTPLYLRLYSYTVMLSVLLPTCCASYTGFAATFVFISIPCCAVPVGMGLLTSMLLPNFGLPANLLAPSLMPPARAVACGCTFTGVALALGPLDAPANVSTALHAAALLVALRIAFNTIRICLLMPALILTDAALPGALPLPDRKLAAVGVGEPCSMQQGGTTFKVTKVRLERDVSAVTITHPRRSNKWVLSLHGNGEVLAYGIEAKLQLALELGCSVIACDFREIGTSPGLLLSGSDMVADAKVCVRYCEEQLGANDDPAASILILGQSMGGGVAAELAATHFPHLACVNLRSFSSLSIAAANTIGLGQYAAGRVAVRAALALAFSNLPWQPPLETAAHWKKLPAGRKLLIHHPDDRVIGPAGLIHTLEQSGALDGTKVVKLGGRPRDAHNQSPAGFAPAEWATAVTWMKKTLKLD